MATYDAWQKRLGIGQEASWSVGVDSSLPLGVTEFPSFDIGKNTAESDQYTGVAYQRIDVKSRSKTAGFPSIPINLNFVTDEMVYFLYGIFQRVWESASSPYGKIFLPYKKSPDFSAKSSAAYPHLISIVGDNRVDSKGYKIDGALPRMLHLESEEGDVLKANMEMVGRSMATNDETQTADDFTSFSTASPLLHENMTSLFARVGAVAGVQGKVAIGGATSISQVVTTVDYSDYVSTGDYISFLITIGSSNDTFDIFETGDQARTVTLTQSDYTPAELCLEMEAAIERSYAFTNTYRVSFDNTDKKFTIARDTGALTFYIDEDGNTEMNATLGFNGTDAGASTSTTSDSAIAFNTGVYVVGTVSGVTLPVTLDEDPTEATIPQKIVIWRKLNIRSFSLDIINNVVSPLYNNTSVINHTLGQFEVTGSFIRPWGDVAADENLLMNNMVAGYRAPMWFYWGDIDGRTAHDFGIFVSAYYTNDVSESENESVLREVEVSFEGVRDSTALIRHDLPCMMVCADTGGSSKSWTTQYG